MIEILSLRDNMADDIGMGLVTFTSLFRRMGCRERLCISKPPSNRKVKSKADVIPWLLDTLFSSRRRVHEGSSSNALIAKSRPPAVGTDCAWAKGWPRSGVGSRHLMV